MKKETVLEALQSFPKDFQLDDLFEKFLVIQKINEGLVDEQLGNTLSHNQLKNNILPTLIHKG